MMPTGPTSLTASMAAWVSRSIAAQSGLATNLRHRDFFRRIAALEIALDAVEDRRRDGDIAFIREAVADCPDVVIHAQDLLDHHDCRLGRRGGIGTIAAPFKNFRSRQFDVFFPGASICFRGLSSLGEGCGGWNVR